MHSATGGRQRRTPRPRSVEAGRGPQAEGSGRGSGRRWRGRDGRRRAWRFGPASVASPPSICRPASVLRANGGWEGAVAKTRTPTGLGGADTSSEQPNCAQCRSGCRTAVAPGFHGGDAPTMPMIAAAEDTPEAREEAAFWEAAAADTWDGLESMQRGDLVVVAMQGDSGKPRPAVVIQFDLFDELPTVTVLPSLVSELSCRPSLGWTWWHHQHPMRMAFLSCASRREWLSLGHRPSAAPK